eukprot:7273753-Alexandrium_andersonii.AAC.1
MHRPPSPVLSEAISRTGFTPARALSRVLVAHALARALAPALTYSPCSCNALAHAQCYCSALLLLN